jgi:hypothetical protein
MALSPESKLRLMKDAVDDQVEAIGGSIEQIQEQIDEATEQADAIDTAMMGASADELESYLNGKAVEYQYPSQTFEGFWETGTSYSTDDIVATITTYDNYVCIASHTASDANEPGVGASWTTYWTAPGGLSTYSVSLGAGYNLTQINEWAIKLLLITIYEYLGAGWDGDSEIIQRQDDWDFGCDYLHHPLGVPADEDNSPDCVLRVASGQKSSYGLYPKIASLNTAKTIITNNQSKVGNSKDIFDRYLED